MKAKLTLTVDRDATADAKKFARRNGTSLSKMVEDQFRKLGQESFAERWYGKFKLPVPRAGRSPKAPSAKIRHDG
jgi:hypothetical protein